MKLFKSPSSCYNDLGKVSLRMWREVHESGDLNRLALKGKPTDKQIKKAWHKLNNQFLEMYGLDNDTKEVIKLRFRFASALAEYLSTGNSSQKMEVKLLQEDIEANNKKSGEKVEFIEIIASVEQALQFQIDEDKTTVTKFYSYLKQIKKQGQRQKEQFNTLKNGKKNI